MSASDSFSANGEYDLETANQLVGSYLSLLRIASPLHAGSQREIDEYQNVKSYLTALAQHLAQDGNLRAHFAGSGALTSMIECFGPLFATFEKVQSSRPQLQTEESGPARAQPASIETKEQRQDPYYRVSYVATLCLRVLRNLLAGCAEAQSILCASFHVVSPLLVNLARFHTLNDPDTLLLARAAVQMLSNLITANGEVQRQMWPRIVMTGQAQQKLVLHFLSSPDTATQSAAQILIINFIRTRDSAQDARRRCLELCTLPEGLEIIESLLTTSESIVLRATSDHQEGLDSDNDSQMGKDGLDESLGFIYTIFSILFESGHSSLLFASLAPLQEISSTSHDSSLLDSSVISSSQLVLLKLLDSWLHVSQKQVATSIQPSSSPGSSSSGGPKLSHLLAGKMQRHDDIDMVGGAGLLGLLGAFALLSKFARKAMVRGTAKDGANADAQPQDRRLIGVHHALLLVLQCLLSIGMTADGWSDVRFSRDALIAHGDLDFGALSTGLLSSMRGDLTFVDELVALLDQTHQYAPALSPFRPTNSADAQRRGASQSSDAQADRPLPEGHALSSTGRAGLSTDATKASYGFDHLKRDLVRVIGSLVYAPTKAGIHGEGGPASTTTPHSESASGHTKAQIRQVQDRVREKGGLYHVLNMTVLDERNPYMREHAIFALRYLLANNVESQSLVSSLQPAQPRDGREGVQLPMV